MESITVEYSLAPEDVDALVRYVGDHQTNRTPEPRTRRWAWIGLGGLALIFVIFLAMAVSRGEVHLVEAPPNPNRGNPAWMFLYILVGIVLLSVPFVLLHVWRSARQSARLRNAGAFDKRILVVAPNGFSETARNGSIQTSWGSLQNIVETPVHLFMMTKATHAYIVPRRAFDSDEDWKRFVGAVKAYHGGGGSNV